MPVVHIKDIPSVSMRTWQTLTDDELDVIVDVINNHSGDCTVEKGEITIGELVGRNSPYGTIIYFSIYSDTRGIPDGLLEELEDALLESEIATRVDKIRVPCDPAGNAFHQTEEHEKTYSAGVRIQGGWNTIKTVDH